MYCQSLKKEVGSGGTTDKLSDGLQFTGLEVRANRADPDDTDLRQPRFERGQFEDRETSRFNSDVTEDY